MKVYNNDPWNLIAKKKKIDVYNVGNIQEFAMTNKTKKLDPYRKLDKLTQKVGITKDV